MAASEFRSQGYNEWLVSPPPRGALIEIMRDGWRKPAVCQKEDVPPESNVANLFWRYTGIAKESR